MKGFAGSPSPAEASHRPYLAMGLRRERALPLVGKVGIRGETPEDWALGIAGRAFAGMAQRASWVEEPA